MHDKTTGSYIHVHALIVLLRKESKVKSEILKVLTSVFSNRTSLCTFLSFQGTPKALSQQPSDNHNSVCTGTLHTPCVGTSTLF